MIRVIVLTILAVSGVSLADETVYAWGYGDILANMLNGIKYTFALGDYQSAVKIAMALGLVFVLISYFGRNTDPLSIFKLYLIQLAVLSLFLNNNVLKTNVYINDLSNPSNSQLVYNVPYLYAKILSGFTKFEKAIGQVFETAFSVPSNLRMSNVGFLTPFTTIANANSFKITDPYLYVNMNNYMQDCVLTAVYDGSADLNTLQQSKNLWSTIGALNLSPQRTSRYLNSNGSSTILDCPSYYNQLSADLSTYIPNKALPTLSKILGQVNSTQLNNLLGTTSSYLLNYSVTGQAYLQQSIAINMFNDSFQNYAKANGISGAGLSFGVAKAEEQARTNMALQGALASKYIPVIKGILTSLIVAMFPVLALMMLTPWFSKVALGQLTVFLWLSLWHLSEVLINSAILIKASNYLPDAVDNNGLSIMTKALIDSQSLDYINMISSMYWMIPTLSFLIASGFSVYAFSSISSSLSGKVSGSTAGVSSQMATGSMDLSSSLTTGNKYNFSSFGNFGASNLVGYGSDIFMSSSTKTATSSFEALGSTLGASLLGTDSLNVLKDLNSVFTSGKGLKQEEASGKFSFISNKGLGNIQALTLTDAIKEGNTIKSGKFTATTKDGKFIEGQISNGHIANFSIKGKDGVVAEGRRFIEDDKTGYVLTYSIGDRRDSFIVGDDGKVMPFISTNLNTSSSLGATKSSAVDFTNTDTWKEIKQYISSDVDKFAKTIAKNLGISEEGVKQTLFDFAKNSAHFFNVDRTRAEEFSNAFSQFFDFYFSIGTRDRKQSKGAKQSEEAKKSKEAKQGEEAKQGKSFKERLFELLKISAGVETGTSAQVNDKKSDINKWTSGDRSQINHTFRDVLTRIDKFNQSMSTNKQSTQEKTGTDQHSVGKEQSFSLTNREGEGYSSGNSFNTNANLNGMDVILYTALSEGKKVSEVTAEDLDKHYFEYQKELSKYKEKGGAVELFKDKFGVSETELMDYLTGKRDLVKAVEKAENVNPEEKFQQGTRGMEEKQENLKQTTEQNIQAKTYQASLKDISKDAKQKIDKITKDIHSGEGIVSKKYAELSGNVGKKQDEELEKYAIVHGVIKNAELIGEAGKDIFNLTKDSYSFIFNSLNNSNPPNNTNKFTKVK